MTNNRWIIAIAGTVAMVCLGTISSWSVFTQPVIGGHSAPPKPDPRGAEFV